MQQPVRLSILFMLILFFACTEKEETEPQVICPTIEWCADNARDSDLAGKWILVKTISWRPRMVVPPAAGDVPPSYEISPDSTFHYTHSDGTQAKGTFRFQKAFTGLKHLMANYQAGGSFKPTSPTVTFFSIDKCSFIEDHTIYDGFTYYYQKVASDRQAAGGQAK